jgi:predicted DCC family thiol-disulfide oxidoreductase YuxK
VPVRRGAVVTLAAMDPAHPRGPNALSTSAGSSAAPGPDGADGIPTLVFDGECRLCVAGSTWVARRWSGPGRAVASQELDRAALARLGLSAAQVADAAWWVDEHGATWQGHQAIARSLVAGGGWRRTVGRALLVPPLRWLAATVYPVVARNRRRLGRFVLDRTPGTSGGVLPAEVRRPSPACRPGRWRRCQYR